MFLYFLQDTLTRLYIGCDKPRHHKKFKISETQQLRNLKTRQLSDSVSLKKSRSDDSSQAGGGVRSTEPLHSQP